MWQNGKDCEAATANRHLGARFEVAEFPGETRPFFEFLQLTNGMGRYATLVELHDLQRDEVLAPPDGSIDFSERLEVQNLIIPVPLIVLAP